MLWRHRNTVLRPLVPLFNPERRPAPYNQARTDPEDEETTEEVPQSDDSTHYLRQWLKIGAAETGTNQKDFNPRLQQMLPVEIEESLTARDQTVHGRPHLPLFRALQYAPFNHLVAWSGFSNNASHHKNMLKYTELELQYFENEFTHLIKLFPSLNHLLHQLHHTIQTFPLLSNAPTWLNLPVQQGEILPIQPSDYPEILIRENRDTRERIFHQALSAFVKRISALDCLGIPSTGVTTVSRLHLGLKPSLEALHATAIPLYHHLAIIKSTKSLARYPTFEPQWDQDSDSEETPEAIMDIAACTSEELQLHYRDSEAKQYQRRGRKRARGDRSDNEEDSDHTSEDEHDNTCPDNEEIAEDAFDVHFGTLRSAQHRQK